MSWAGMSGESEIGVGGFFGHRLERSEGLFDGCPNVVPSGKHGDGADEFRRHATTQDKPGGEGGDDCHMRVFPSGFRHGIDGQAGIESQRLDFGLRFVGFTRIVCLSEMSLRHEMAFLSFSRAGRRRGR